MNYNKLVQVRDQLATEQKEKQDNDSWQKAKEELGI